MDNSNLERLWTGLFDWMELHEFTTTDDVREIITDTLEGARVTLDP